MKVGDEAFYYHSQEGLAVVGIAKRRRASAFPDPTDPSRPIRGGGVRAGAAAAKTPVTLAEIKATPALAGMRMLRQFRLSVTPITPDEWADDPPDGRRRLAFRTPRPHRKTNRKGTVNNGGSGASGGVTHLCAFNDVKDRAVASLEATVSHSYSS